MQSHWMRSSWHRQVSASFPEPAASSLADPHVKRCAPRDQGRDHSRRGRGRRWPSGTCRDTQSRQQLGLAVAGRGRWLECTGAATPEPPAEAWRLPAVQHRAPGAPSSRYAAPNCTAKASARRGRREHAQSRACRVLPFRRGGTEADFFLRAKVHQNPRTRPALEIPVSWLEQLSHFVKSPGSAR